MLGILVAKIVAHERSKPQRNSQVTDKTDWPRWCSVTPRAHEQSTQEYGHQMTSNFHRQDARPVDTKASFARLSARGGHAQAGQAFEDGPAQATRDAQPENAQDLFVHRAPGLAWPEL